jgi:hypothetical protein
MSITERIRATLAAVPARRAARRDSRGDRELKRQAATARRAELKHRGPGRSPDDGGRGAGIGAGF